MPWSLWLVVSASAWDTSGIPPWEEPVAFLVADQAAGAPEEALSAAEGAADMWSEVPCSDLEIAVVGRSANPPPRKNATNEISFDALEAGTLLSVTFHGGAKVHPDGTITTEITEVDLGLQSSGVEWLSNAQAASEDCTGEAYSLQAVMTHAMGHAAGLATTDGAGASMARLTPCDITAVDLSDDDRLGLQSLYGALATPVCEVDGSADLRGPVPLDVRCDVQADPDVDFRVDWSAGTDAGTTPVFEPIFDEEGVHDIEGCATVVADDACTPLCVIHGALACSPPTASIRVVQEGGTTLLLNETPLVDEGCVDHVRWEVRDAAGDPWAVRDDWEMGLQLPDGSWSAVLWVEGPGGVDVTEVAWSTSGCGCAGPGPAPSWAIGPLLIAVVFGRRRDPRVLRSDYPVM